MVDARRYKELENENGELKKMLADEMLKNRVVIEEWRNFYSRIHPHSRFGFQSPNDIANKVAKPSSEPKVQTGPKRVVGSPPESVLVVDDVCPHFGDCLRR